MKQWVKSKFNLKVRCLNYHMGKCYRDVDSPKECKRLDGKACKYFDEIIVCGESEQSEGQAELFGE